MVYASESASYKIKLESSNTVSIVLTKFEQIQLNMGEIKDNLFDLCIQTLITQMLGPL